MFLLFLYKHDAVVLQSNTKSPTGVHRLLESEGIVACPQGILAGVTGCILAYWARINMVKGWGSKWFLR